MKLVLRGIVFAALLAGTVDADTLQMTLNVRGGEVPKYLCVIAARDGCTPTERKESDCPRSLKTDFKLGDDARELTSEQPFPAAESPAQLSPPMASAVASLTASPTHCHDDAFGCRPAFVFPGKTFKTKNSEGFLSCAENAFSSSEKTALVWIYAIDDEPQLKGLELQGTVATVYFKGTPSKQTSAQVIGGHYSRFEQTAERTGNRLVVKLEPRCVPLVAELPKSAYKIKEICLDSGPQPARPACARRCAPLQRDASVLDIGIPHIPRVELKTLTVVYDAPSRPASVATWTEPLPPVPLRFGVRSFEFSWRRPTDCFSETWSEQTHSTETWSASCPRVTLPDGSYCGLGTRERFGNFDDHVPPPRCDYVCRLSDNVSSLQLPVALRFDRMRMQGTTEMVVYSWNDQILYSDQQLESSVASADRRVMLEFKHRDQWRDRRGDTLDAIRLVIGNYSQQLELSEPGAASLGPPPWTAIPTPGRTCSDRLRIAVFGRHFYREKTEQVDKGRVLLKDPAYYRLRNWPYVSAGIGLQYYDFPRFGEPYGELGLGFVTNPPSLRSLSFSGEMTLSLSRTLYGPIEQSTVPADPDRVTYVRVGALAAMEYWLVERMHWMIGAGLSAGVPLDYSNNSRAGFGTLSWLFETGAVVPLGQGRFSLLILLGLRTGEDRYDFQTDFLGGPRAKQSDHAQPYITVRFRGRAG